MTKNNVVKNSKIELISFSEMLMVGPFFDQRQFFAPEIEFLKGGNEALQISGLIKEDSSELIEYHNRVAVITIDGPMRPGRDWYYSTGYGSIQDAIVELIDSDVKTVIQRLKTPGGTVDQAFETEEMFYELAKEKKLISFIEMATSAGALLTFPAHERYISGKTSQTGSIGVVAEHVDNRIWYKEFLGEIRTSVASGDFKDAGTDTRGFDEKAKEIYESSVLKLKGVFVDSAAKGLNKSIKEIEDQESRVFIGDEGIKNGFADGLSSLNELIEQNNNSTLFTPGRPAFSNIHNEVKSMDINKLKAEHQDVYQAIKKEGGDERETAIKQTFIDQGKNMGQIEERKRISEIKALALPGQDKLTAEMIEDGTPAGEAAGKFLGDQKAKLEATKAAIEGDLNKPLASDAPGEVKKPEADVKNPVADHTAAVLKAMDGGKVSKGEAMKYVKNSQPELHKAFIENQNQGGK